MTPENFKITIQTVEVGPVIYRVLGLSFTPRAAIRDKPRATWLVQSPEQDDTFSSPVPASRRAEKAARGVTLVSTSSPVLLLALSL